MQLCKNGFNQDIVQFDQWQILKNCENSCYRLYQIFFRGNIKLLTNFQPRRHCQVLVIFWWMDITS